MQTKLLRRLDGQTFLRLVAGGAAQLRANAKIVNDLNVFPIPDGDTGENMCLTIGGGLRRAQEMTKDDLGAVSEGLASGMLLSARGNSGVILSQLFAGIAAGLRGIAAADVSEFADALQSGVRYAYAAVVTPTEGTILTVAREAADYAQGRINAQTSFSEFGQDYFKALGDSLRRTPELLAVLKEAGVIDSGGAGLYYIVDGMLRTARGEEIAQAEMAFSAPQQAVDFSAFTEDSVMEFGYCTEFLLQLQRSKCDVDAFDTDALIAWLSERGDSIVAFKTGTVVKVHVHTMHPGAVLEYCQSFGEYLTVKIENMTLQHHESTVQNAFEAQSPKEKKEYAIVTVATGQGLCETFRELGADFVIEGGQGHNPSTEDFIGAFDAVCAKTIFVLPNNGNILLAAKQAAALYEGARVIVVPSRDIGQGYAALAMHSYDSGDSTEIAKEMEDAMQGVLTGEVSRSVRDAKLDGIAIRENDYIGFAGKTMYASDADKVETAMQLLARLDAVQHEILLVIYGAEVSAQEKAALHARVQSAMPRTELYEIDGGQAVYDFLLILQ